MKYYVVGKNSIKGASYDVSGDLNQYYELGWEIMITHSTIKKFLYEKKVEDDDVIVTTNNERKFLYDKKFKNVISWDEFTKIKNLDGPVIDLVNDSAMGKCSAVLPEINNIELKNILNSFVIDENIISKTRERKYVCLQFRKRDWCPERNIDDTFFHELVKFFTDNKGVDVYVMGYGGERFCDNKNVFYVNLQEFTTLINYPNCLLFFSGMSGPAHLSYFFGHKKLLHIVNSVHGPRTNDLINHPLFMGDIYNMTGVNVKILPYKINVSDIINVL